MGIEDALETVDLAVIGAGPAGLAAGVYGSRAGLSTVLLDRISSGGQLVQTDHLENYPGFAQDVDGFDLAWAMREQAVRFGARIVSEDVQSVDLSADPKTIATPFCKYRARAVILATGARPRRLGVDGEGALTGSGISYCTTCDGNFFRGEDVAVVGGGDTAATDALYLARICSRVYLVHRRDELRATAIYRERLEAAENVEFVLSATVRRLLSAEGRLSGIEVADVATGATREIACAGLFVAVGIEPNTAFLAGALPTDGAGYIVAGETCETGVPGVYAAGDIRTKPLRQVVTAVADGAVAAERAAEWLAARG